MKKAICAVLTLVLGGVAQALALFLALLVYAPSASAATFTAATCNYADVNTLINGPTHTAVAGDVIIIPAGTCTWTSVLAFSVGITVRGTGTPNSTPSTFGAGTLNTIINSNTGGAVINASAIPFGQFVHISSLDLEPAASNLSSPIQISGTCTSSGCPTFRVDNIGLGLTTKWSPSTTGNGTTWLVRVDNIFGVMDHNSEPPPNDAVFADIELDSLNGVGAFGDNAWATPDTFGTANTVYMENNNVYITRSFTDCEIGNIGGCKQVGRFNSITSSNGFGTFGLHGLDTDGRPRAGRQLEVYGNNMVCILHSCNIIAGYRGGTGYTFGNTLTETNDGFFNSFFSITVFRNVLGAGGGWGYCDGQSPYDTNDGVTYYSGTIGSVSNPDPGKLPTQTLNLTMTDGSKSFTSLIPTGAPYSIVDTTAGFGAEIASNTGTTITMNGNIPETSNGFTPGDSYLVLRATICADQGGRGQGALVSGTPPSPSAALNQALDPIYEWNDSENPHRLNNNGGANTKRIIADRDYYTDNSNGNPVANSSPTSPFNGTTGVGFGTLANRPSSCSAAVGYFATDQGSWNSSGNGFGQGILYGCSGGSWVQDYTPYTYPHPLIGSSPAPPPPPAPSPVMLTFSAVPLPPTQTPIQPTLTSVSPTKTYVTAKGCSQNGAKWLNPCSFAVSCTSCDGTTILTLDGTVVTQTYASGVMTAVVPLSLLPAPSQITLHSFSASNPAPPVPVLQ